MCVCVRLPHCVRLSPRFTISLAYLLASSAVGSRVTAAAHDARGRPQARRQDHRREGEERAMRHLLQGAEASRPRAVVRRVDRMRFPVFVF